MDFLEVCFRSMLMLHAFLNRTTASPNLTPCMLASQAAGLCAHKDFA